jgi:copper(I)-binding protein
MRIALLLAAATLLFAGCDHASSSAEQGVSITDAWIRLPAAPGRPGAAYFTLHANGAPARLLTVTGKVAQRIELHDSNMAGGMMHMEPLKDASMSEGATLTFEPGGRHAMLFGIDRSARAGTATVLDFAFADGRKAKARAAILAAGDPPPH